MTTDKASPMAVAKMRLISMPMNSPFEIVRGRTEGAADRGAIENHVEDARSRRSPTKRQQRHDADRNAAAKRNRSRLDRARAQPLAVGGERLVTIRSG